MSDEKNHLKIVVDPLIWRDGRPSFDPRAAEELRAQHKASRLQELLGQCREGETETCRAIHLMDESVTAFYAYAAALFENAEPYTKLRFLLSLLIRRIRILRDVSHMKVMDGKEVQEDLDHLVKQVEDELKRTKTQIKLLRTKEQFKENERTHFATFRFLLRNLPNVPH